MKKYMTPEMEIIEISQTDIITTSGNLNVGGNGDFSDVGGGIEWGE